MPMFCSTSPTGTSPNEREGIDAGHGRREVGLFGFERLIKKSPPRTASPSR